MESIDKMKSLLKSNKYWEDEFNSGKFTKSQIEQLLSIDFNKYDKITAKDYGFDSEIIYEIPVRKNLRNKFLNRPDMKDAIHAFYDVNRIEEYDEEHSTQDEDRYKLIGMDKNSKVVDVIYFEREENIIRIISVFKASKEEVEQYVKQ